MTTSKSFGTLMLLFCYQFCRLDLMIFKLLHTGLLIVKKQGCRARFFLKNLTFLYKKFYVKKVFGGIFLKNSQRFRLKFHIQIVFHIFSNFSVPGIDFNFKPKYLVIVSKYFSNRLSPLRPKFVVNMSDPKCSRKLLAMWMYS